MVEVIMRVDKGWGAYLWGGCDRLVGIEWLGVSEFETVQVLDCCASGYHGC